MPKSRKRKPAGPRQNAQLNAAVVPTRGQREHYAETTPPDQRAADLEAANAVMARAGFNERPNALITRAYQALLLSPLCSEAYVTLYDTHGDPDQALDYLKRGIHAAMLALRGLSPGEDAFWEHSEGPVLMDARLSFATELLDGKQEHDAIAVLETLLEDDPQDRIGARTLLLDVLLDQDDVQPARDLLNRFPDDHGIEWAYGRLLVSYREEHRRGPNIQALMAAALAANPHVPELLGGTYPDEQDLDQTGPGTPDEAEHYVRTFAPRWDAEPGAVDWLLALNKAPPGPTLDFP